MTAWIIFATCWTCLAAIGAAIWLRRPARRLKTLLAVHKAAEAFRRGDKS